MSPAVSEGARLRSGRYELERLLGRGGAASVWLARDTLLERPVAVKVLSEGLAADRDWLARFRREARIAARLQHPNLVSIYDFDAEAERPYLVMAYMPGGSLATRLDNGGWPEVERLAADLLRALEHIHAAGIVHRDVKPANVLLDRDGRACLTDFGIARPEDATSITQTGHIPGTARYMAPELWQGEPATERSDLFACGVVLSQCLRDEGASARLIGLVERLTAESPDLRPRSAAAALEMLIGPPPPARDETPATAVAAPAPPTLSPPRRAGAGPRWPAIAALALVAAALGAAIAGALDGGDAGDFQRAGAGDGGGGQQQEQSREGGGQSADTDGSAGAGGDAGDSADSAALGASLNEQGYALIQEGAYEEAVPVLQRAVDAFPDGTTDLNYAYALFNLGNALRLAGRPEEAIPILEERLQIPNQTETVKAELELAKEDLKAQEEAAKEAEKQAKEED